MATASPVAQEQSPYTLSVNVNLVLLPVAVADRSGGSVAGLEEGNFHVYEDGVPQSILYFDHEDVPVAMGLVLDNSRSMGPKYEQVVLSAMHLARASNPIDRMFVIHFSEDVEFGLEPGEAFTGNVQELVKAVARTPPPGETALYDAIAAGLEHLGESSLKKRVLVVVSDGGDNASRHTLDQVLKEALESETIIYTVGLFDESDGDRNPHVLGRLARETGGERFLPKDIHLLPGICTRIARDIRSQYTVAYASKNARKDGTYRSVRVTVSAPGHGRLLVRTRAGYFAPLGSVPSALSP